MTKMTFRLLGAILMATLLLAACGRRLPEDGVVGSASGAAVANAPTTADQSNTGMAEASADTGAANASAEEAEADAEVANNEEDASNEEAEADTEDAGEREAETVAVAGDPALGQTVFNQSYNTASGPWICASCHSVDESQIRLIGPGLWGLGGEIGEQRIAESGDGDVTEYIRNSIIHPNDYIVPGDSAGPYPQNLMPQNYEDLFSEEELDGLVAYIMTLQ